MVAVKLERYSTVSIPIIVPPIIAPITGYPGAVLPFDDSVPFTARSGASFAELFYGMRKHIDVNVIPHMDENQSTLITAWNDATTAIVDSVNDSNAALTADVNETVSTTVEGVEASLTATETQVTTQLAANVEYVDESVQSIINSTIAVTDPVVAAALTSGTDTMNALNDFNAGFNRPSVMLRDYVAPGNTDAANRTGYLAAITAANTFGLAICYDGATFDFAGEPLPITATGQIHWATGNDTHKVTQNTRMKGVLLVSATDCLFENLTFDGDNPTLIGFVGQVISHSAGIFVQPTAHRTTVRNFKVAGFKVGVFGALGPYAEVSATTNASGIVNINDTTAYPPLTALLVDGIDSQGCWAAFVPQAVKGWTARNVTGWYQKMPQAGAEAHLIYATGVGTSDEGDTGTSSRTGTDGVMEDCHSTGGDQRHAFRVRGQKGVRLSRLRATNTPGLIQILECEDVEIQDGCSSIDDKLSQNDNVGSISIYTSKRVRQAPAYVQFATNVVAPPGGSIQSSEDVVVTGIKVIDNSPTVNPNTASPMYRLGGVNPRSRLVRPDLSARGAGAARIGVFMGSAGDGDPQGVIEDPLIKGNVTIGVRISLTGTLIYTPGDIEGVSRIMQLENVGAKVVNRLSGIRPDLDKSIVAWLTGEVASSGSTNPPTVWGNGQTRAYANGTWTSDPLIGEVSTTAGGLSSSALALTADIQGECQVRRGTTTRAGIQLRVNSTSSFIAFVLTATGAELIKYESGTTTVLATYAGAAFPGVAFHDLKVLAVGTRIIGYVNGVQVIDHTLAGGDDATYVAVNHGIFVNTTSNPLARFKRILFRSLA